MKKLLKKIRKILGRRQSGGVAHAIADLKADDLLHKKKPSHLVERQYTILDDEAAIESVFSRMKDALFETASELDEDRPLGQARKVQLESGKLSEGRRYFYLQPWSSEGYLFERSPHGWTVAKAEKIVGDQTFLRHSDTWDVVTLYRPDQFKGLLRISSQRMGDELMSFPVYEEMLKDNLAIL